MNKIYQKIPFLLELIINGSFIALHSLYKSETLTFKLISPVLLEQLLLVLSYLAPFVILVTIIGHFKQSSGKEDFFRRHIFSLFVFIPLVITLGDAEFAFWLTVIHLFSSILSLYEGKPLEKKVTKEVNTDITASILEKIKLQPAQVLMLSFTFVIGLGTILLALPLSAVDGKHIDVIDAFFTATSATCVTGLSTISLADNFSFIGQIIVLLLIQIGGLGYMTLYSSLVILLGKSLALNQQVLMQDLLDLSSFENLLSMIIDIIKFTVVIELIGAIILTIAFSYEGHEFGEALYFGVFHSISAFCNAGFALFNDSLETYGLNPFIQGTISVLIVLGGLGFIVIKELETVILMKRKILNLSVHSKIVLSTNFFLITGVAMFIFFNEFLHSLSSYSFWDQVQLSLFQSITTRTAGFNTISLTQLYPHTLYLMCLVMFIGASPGSTGGGIKTTTFALLFQSVKATLRGRSTVEFFDRRVPNILVVRAVAIIVISLILVSGFILLIMRLESEQSFLSIFFEVVSAFSTVGLSLGITPYLSFGGKLAIIVLMFVGRIGPLTLALAIGQKGRGSESVEFPIGRIMIG